MKEALVTFCSAYIDDKIEAQQKLIDQAKSALYAEGKSSAGDKHETGRAMAQLEMEKAGSQYQELLKLKQIVNRLGKGQGRSDQIGLDTLVETDKGFFFLAISIGPVKIEENTIVVISPQSPLGAGFIGKNIGETNSFNQAKILRFH